MTSSSVSPADGRGRARRRQAGARAARRANNGAMSGSARVRPGAGGRIATARSVARRYARHLTVTLADGDRLAASPAGNARSPREAIAELARSPFGAAWLGHATVLLRVGGVTILTDPVLGHAIGPEVGPLKVGLPRLFPPPIAPADLPPIDVILVTHAHFDHLDRPTLRRLVNPATTIVTARRTGRLIPPGFRRVVELDWAGTAQVHGVQVRAVRPVHPGGRHGIDALRRCNSYVLRAAGRRVLVGGDTARTDAFDRLAGIDLAVLGIGAYTPREHAHATPEQVWEMFTRFGGRFLLPVHHSTFPLGDEGPGEALERLLAAAGSARERVLALRPGESWAPPHEASA